MSSHLKNYHWGSTLYAVTALIIGLGVLFISLAKASLQIWAVEDVQNQLRTKPIDFVITYTDGSTESGSYKLPEIKTLPTSPLYTLKTARNYLWLRLTKGEFDRSKMALLIADKNMTEAQILFSNKESKSGLLSSVEAIDKLKYAYNEINDTKIDNIEVNQLKSQIVKAGYAYKVVLEKSKDTLNPDNKTEYNKIIKDLEKWNEERKKEKIGN